MKTSLRRSAEVLILCGLLVSLLGPWWCLPLAMVLMGYFARELPPGVPAGLAALGMFIVTRHFDGASGYMISEKMAAMFGLPAPWGIYVIMALMGGVTAGLWFQAGRVLRGGPKPRSAGGSDPSLVN